MPLDARGSTHRDLKPANVMVTDAGHVKVLDFGLATVCDVSEAGAGLETAQGDILTRQGRIVGTIAYMSPEQAEARAVDARSDVFSLGVMLYEMATGTRPFQGDTSLRHPCCGQWEGVRRLTNEGFNPSWSPDGQSIVYATEETTFNPGGRGPQSLLWIVSITTGERRQLTTVDAVQPAWSPHGYLSPTGRFRPPVRSATCGPWRRAGTSRCLYPFRGPAVESPRCHRCRPTGSG